MKAKCYFYFLLLTVFIFKTAFAQNGTISDKTVEAPYNKVTEEFIEKLLKIENNADLLTFLKTVFKNVNTEMGVNLLECYDNDELKNLGIVFHKKGEVSITLLPVELYNFYRNKYRSTLKGDIFIVKNFEISMIELFGSYVMDIKYFDQNQNSSSTATNHPKSKYAYKIHDKNMKLVQTMYGDDVVPLFTGNSIVTLDETVNKYSIHFLNGMPSKPLDFAKVLNHTYDSKYLFVKSKANSQYGLLDNSGKVIVEPKYEYIEQISEGLISVQEPGTSLWGFMDFNGNWAIKPEYDYIQMGFKNGYCTVSKNKEEFVINKKNERITSTHYFELNNGFITAPNNLLPKYNKYTKTTIYNSKKEILFELDGNERISGFYKNKAFVYSAFGFQRFAIVDMNGTDIIKLEEPNLSYSPQPHGFIGTAQGYGKNGLIDMDGKMIVAPINETIFVYSPNYIVVKENENSNYKILNGEGKLLMTTTYLPSIIDDMVFVVEENNEP